MSYRHVTNSEPWLVQYLPTSGDVAIDIGANVGNWTRDLSLLFDTVIAFEPDDRAFNQLIENLDEFKVNNVVTYRTAVASENGELLLWQYEESAHTSVFDPAAPEFEPWRSKPVGKQVSVPCVALDDVYKAESRKIDFIKVDVEGAEDMVIQGADYITAKHRPVWLIEIHTKRTRGWCLTELVNRRYTVRDIPHPDTPSNNHCWLLATP